MQAPKIPADESLRLRALRATGLLDTAAEERFDRLTRLAQKLFKTQFALVSLVDAERQWFKSRQGLDACETSREVSFCGHAILEKAIFEVPDASQDPRFADNPLVIGPPHIRFYAGAPLSTADGYRIGTLCIIDSHPRVLTADERHALRDLADCVEVELNALREGQLRARLKASEARSATILRAMPDIVLVVDRNGCFLDSNEHPDLLVPRAELLERCVGDLLPPDLARRCMEAVRTTLATGTPLSFDYSLDLPRGPAEFEARFQKLDEHEVLIVIRNISVEKAARAELMRLSAVASQTTNGVVVTDVQGRVEWINEAFTRITGYALDEIRGCTPGEVLQGPDTDPAAVKLMHDALAKREPFDVDVVNYTKGGQPYWVRVNCNPMRDAEGALQGFLAIESDITREKTDAERIRTSERRLAAVIEGTHIGTWEWNVQSGETAFNERWAEIVGYTLDELAPVSIQTWVDLAHPDDLKVSNVLLEKVFRRELDYYDCQCRMRHKQGHWVWVHDRGSMVSWSEDGKPLLMSGTHADISAQKQAELALQESETRLRGLFELSPVGIALNDFETGEFLDANAALLAMSGYTRQELRTLSYRDMTPRDYEAQEKQQLELLTQTGRYGPYEKEYIRKDGSHYPVVLNGTLVPDVSGRKLIWSIVEDITERKRIERMKSEFVSTVSHELRTPLTSIAGALGLIAGGALGELPERARDMIDIAYKNSQRLSFLVNDLLDMEKLLAGKLRFDMQVLPLMPLVEQAVHDNQSYAVACGVRLTLASRTDGVQVTVDPDRFQQVMANLLSNAAKFSPPGEQVVVALSRRDDHVRVEVRDHGPGIPEEFHSRIFEKFSQADASDTRAKGGTGLGLAITKGLVDRMNGRIGFECVTGQGTVFWFELPIA